MKRIFSVFAVTTALSVSAAPLVQAESAQAGATASTSVQAQTQADTGFFDRLGNNVRGWFSRDNDAQGRAAMAVSPSVNTGATSTAEIQADMEEEARSSNRTNPAAGASTTQGNLERSQGVGVGVGAGIGTEMGGGTATGMGNIGADTTIGAGVRTGTQTGTPQNP